MIERGKIKRSQVDRDKVERDKHIGENSGDLERCPGWALD